MCLVSFCQVRASHVGSREGTRVGGGVGWCWSFPAMLRAAFLYWLWCRVCPCWKLLSTGLNRTSVLATPDPHRQNWQMQVYPRRLTSLRLLLWHIPTALSCEIYLLPGVSLFSQSLLGWQTIPWDLLCTITQVNVWIYGGAKVSKSWGVACHFRQFRSYENRKVNWMTMNCTV